MVQGKNLKDHPLTLTEAKNPKKAIRLKRAAAERASNFSQLRDVIEQLRNETASESEKEQWLQDFESQTQQPLSEIEHYILKEWNG